MHTSGVTSGVVPSSPHISRRYPAFIALTDSCANPKPSACLRSPSARRSLPVAASPGWESDLPDVISADLSQHVWSPTPAASRVLSPVSSPGALAFPKWVLGRRFATPPTATSVGMSFSALQTFTHVQTCCFARHSDRPYPRLFRGRAAVTFTSAPITVCYLPVQRIY